MARLLLIPCFLVGTAAIAVQGLLAAPLPAGESYVVIGPGLVVVGVLAALLVAAGIAPLPAAIGCMAACAPAVALYHITVEVSADPTAHNLWPIELVFVGVVGAAPAVAGGLAGLLLRRLAGGRQSG